MKIFFLLVIVLIACNSCQSQAVDSTLLIVPGENRSITSNVPGLAIVEPHLSILPGNDDHLLVAAMIITNKDNPYETARLASFVSTDGGNTWKQTDHNLWGYDPWTAILPNGKTLMTWLGHPDKFREQMIIQVLQSDDGGINWKPGTQAINGEYDGTKMAVSNITNSIVFAAAKFSSGMKVDLYFDKSSNGEKLSASVTIDCKGSLHAFTQPVVLSDETIVVAYTGPNNNVSVRSSADGGKTFSKPYTVTKIAGHTNGYNQLAADLTKDRLYFVRATDGIWLNYSQDKGKTWSKDIRADMFLNGSASHAMVPSVAVNKNGVLGISWVDKQTDHNKTDLYFAASRDGGISFSRPVRVSSVSTNAKTSANADVANKFPGGGHYSAIAVKQDGSFQLVWSDSRTGVFQLQTCNISVK